MKSSVIHDIRDIPAADWNRVTGTEQPFLRHEFLAALERHNCVGESWGWLPRHIAVQDDGGQLCGVTPLYLKDNSYGEFVFDWNWADAWQRAGLAYYPKLVSAIPYTPVTGSRLLVAPGADHHAVRNALINAAVSLAEDAGVSSLHWLFTTPDESSLLLEHKHLRRTSCHFHWHNKNYATFEEFLSDLSSRKRKKIRRERQRITEAGIRMEILQGSDMTDELWDTLHAFYRSTFEQKWGAVTLSAEFFCEISRTMGEQLVLVFAYKDDFPVAGAIMFRSGTALYGRYWGCRGKYNSLHFETCYYQGIDYCIKHGLDLFEPGVQGEHKISRGFLPTYTWSLHWIKDPRFHEVIQNFLLQEHELLVDYHDDLQQTSPFRKSG